MGAITYKQNMNPDDVDIFKISVSLPGTLLISINGANSGASLLTIYDGRNNPPTLMDLQSIGQSQVNLSVSVGPGMYYVRILGTATPDSWLHPYAFRATFTGSAAQAPLATPATNVAQASFTANWNASIGAMSYRLDVATNSVFTNYVSGYQDKTVNGLSNNVTGLTANTPYWYGVRAVNTVGTSGNSNIISATTSPITQPQQLCVNRTTWDSPAGGGGSPAVSVTNCGGGNAFNYSVSDDKSWITVSPISGTTSGSFTITTTSNTTGTQRTGTVTVTASGITGSPKTITVTQPPITQPQQLCVSLTTWNSPVGGGISPAVNVANCGGGNAFNYSVSDDQSWITVSPISGTTSGSFTITTTSNTTGTQRTGTVTVTASGITGSPKTITVTQPPITQPQQLCVSLTTWNSPVGGGISPAVNVANCGGGNAFNYSVTDDQSWIIVSPISGITPGNFTITTTSNTTGTQRTGTVTVIASGITGSPKTITVTQSATPQYTISTSSNPPEGGTTSGGGNYADGEIATVVATSNPGYTFVNWTENGSYVTADAYYRFGVQWNGDWVANFTSCSYTLDIYSTSAISSATSGAFWVKTESDCNWTATTSGCNGMITLKNATGTGDGLITFDISANENTSPRMCTITVEGQTFTVNQLGYVAPCSNAPANPIDLSVRISGSNELYVTWSGNNTNVTDFLVEKGLSETGPFEVIGSSGNYFGYRDSNVLGGTRYYYRVKACCNSNCSNYTNVASQKACTFPTQQSGVIATADTILQGESVTLTVQGGSLGTEAAWTWRITDCHTGPIVGTGSSITVTPDNSTYYMVKPEGGNCAFGLMNCSIAFIEVIQLPTITVSTTSLPDFGSIEVGTNSAPQTYTVSGNDLTTDISITAISGFQISTSSNSEFGNSLTLTQSDGTVPTTTIYARFSPTSTGFQSGNISHTSSGATNKYVSISGTGIKCTGVTIVIQPQNQIANVGDTATFNVSVNGTAPFQYFWFKNGVQIPGASSPSYTTPTLSSADNGSTFYCNITNCNFQNGVTSSSTTLTVNTITSVELAAFSAQVEAGDVHLSWLTETNNYGFDVEKSSDGESFQKIAFVPGHGTTMTAQRYEFVDEKVAIGSHYYRLRQIYFEGVFDYSSTLKIDLAAPEAFALSQNYPNPFNPTTAIQFEVPAAGKVQVTVFNSLGRPIRTLVDAHYAPGAHSTTWDGRNDAGRSVSSGVYFYTIRSGNFSQTRRMIFVK